jgi:hypothetical protein
MSKVNTTIEDLKKKWDTFSTAFEQVYEPHTKITAYNMLSTLRLREVYILPIDNLITNRPHPC